jgi:hypothetical protein
MKASFRNIKIKKLPPRPAKPVAASIPREGVVR